MGADTSRAGPGNSHCSREIPAQFSPLRSTYRLGDEEAAASAIRTSATSVQNAPARNFFPLPSLPSFAPDKKVIVSSFATRQTPLIDEGV